METSTKSRLIKLIHTQKRQAGLNDAEYRALLMGASSGKDSCTAMNHKELFNVFNGLNHLLIKQGQKPFVFVSRPGYATLKDAVLARAENVLGEDYKSRLDGFLARMKKPSLKDCSDKDLRQIMGFLSTLERTNKG